MYKCIFFLSITAEMPYGSKRWLNRQEAWKIINPQVLIAREISHSLTLSPFFRGVFLGMTCFHHSFAEAVFCKSVVLKSLSVQSLKFSQ